jgi:2,4-dienoyl-CoA reductase-like NADH-dependent reductase (Old Yellow Enzyme family)
VQAVREEASRHGRTVLLVAQLNHAGRQKIAPAGEAVSASAVCERTLWTRPRAMTDAEVDRAIEDFAQAARRARDAGFDGVELHAGHGYLINQFLSPMTNRRSGLYACDRSGTTSALVDALMARVRQTVGDRFLIMVKLNGADRFFRGLRPWGPRLGIEESAAIAEHFARAGAHALTITVGHYESLLAGYRGESWAFFRRYVTEGVGQDLPSPMRQMLRFAWPVLALVGSVLWSRKEGFNLDYAERVRTRLQQARLTNTVVICVGGFYRVHEIEQALKRCDAVSIGRAMLAEPKLYAKLTGHPAGDGACVHCNQCFALAGRHPARCYNDAVQAGLVKSARP